MNSRITLKCIFITAILFATSLFTPSVHAQDGQEITASIPFEFSVNRLHFEAGSYKFNLALDKFGMSVINLNTGKKRFVTVRPQNNFASPETGFLVFSETGEDHYLSEVHFSGTAGYSRLSFPQKSGIRYTNTILQPALWK